MSVAKSRWREPNRSPPLFISFCTCIYTRPNDIRRGTNLWLILTDNTFEQFDENHDFDQIDGNYTLENYMEKGGSVGPLECIFWLVGVHMMETLYC